MSKEHMDNTTVRYAPTTMMMKANKGRGFNFYKVPVVRYVIHPPNNHPKECPLVKECTAIEFVTEYGSRWWGVGRAWINSELRVVATGFDVRNELVNKWEVAKGE